MKATQVILLMLAMTLPASLNAQWLHNAEFQGGWVHITGNSGVDGLNLGGALWFTPRVSIAFDFDHASDNNNLTLFALSTGSGLITIHNSLQDYLIGPRIFFHSKNVKVLHTLHPFAEAEFGATHLTTSFNQVGVGGQSTSDNAGSWLLGGGSDVLFSNHWSGRMNIGLLRTHLANAGQSRLRFSMGVSYTFGNRKGY